MSDVSLERRAGKSSWDVSGPIQFGLLMSAAVGTDLAFQFLTHDVTPGLFLLPAVMLAGALGGTTPGCVAAAITVAFAAVDLSRSGPLLDHPYDRLIRLAVLAVAAPAVALGTGLLRRRIQELTAERVQAERDRAAARVEAESRAFAFERSALVTERRGLESERDALARTDRQNQQRLSDLIGTVPGVFWEATVDAAGTVRVTFISRYVEQLLGYPVDQWTASPDLWLSAIHVDDRERVRQRLVDACAGRADVSPSSDSDAIEFRWIGRDAAEVWAETRVSVVPGAAPGDRCAWLRGVTLDVTARHRLEAALRDRAAELSVTARQLRESNDELDQFAYVASHDLKAPLRGIANLSNWIEEDLGPDRVTAEAHGQFDMIRGRVQRMERLIDGLLQFSRIGRTASTVEWVDVGQLMAEVIDWVGPPPHIRVTVGPGMPAFNADRLRLGQVLVNLVGNAVKHHGAAATAGTADGWVHVTCGPPNAADQYEFAVTDDGPGIDPRYHERIFGVFQTLQPRDKVEGTGIGLALVRKVVAAKGGNVRVESAVGKGATFRFTWPRVDPAQPQPAAPHPAARPVPLAPPSPSASPEQEVVS